MGAPRELGMRVLQHWTWYGMAWYIPGNLGMGRGALGAATWLGLWRASYDLR
jgi:hypothetical protein